MNEFKLLIDGKLVTGAASLDVIDPATEDVIAKAPRADRAQLDEAVAAAKAAFPAWSAKPIRETRRAAGQVGRRAGSKTRRVRAIADPGTGQAAF